ncbi:hypothetical protein TNCV_3628551 [Trichonephila clavipes]|nr:hypothetical protein TNCV_3628551 [Trichonephila clavipes]
MNSSTSEKIFQIYKFYSLTLSEDRFEFWHLVTASYELNLATKGLQAHQLARLLGDAFLLCSRIAEPVLHEIERAESRLHFPTSAVMAAAARSSYHRS